jgi:hypothetical protein
MASVKESLKNLVSALGGTSTERSVRGVLGEVSEALEGSSEADSIREQIDNIVAAKGGGGSDEAVVDSAIVGTNVVG